MCFGSLSSRSTQLLVLKPKDLSAIRTDVPQNFLSFKLPVNIQRTENQFVKAFINLHFIRSSMLYIYRIPRVDRACLRLVHAQKDDSSDNIFLILFFLLRSIFNIFCIHAFIIPILTRFTVLTLYKGTPFVASFSKYRYPSFQMKRQNFSKPSFVSNAYVLLEMETCVSTATYVSCILSIRKNIRV